MVAVPTATMMVLMVVLVVEVVVRVVQILVVQETNQDRTQEFHSQ